MKLFRRLDTEAFRMDELLNLLQEIVPTFSTQMKLEFILRSHGYNLMYRRFEAIDEGSMMELMSGTKLDNIVNEGLKTIRYTILQTRHISWQPNEIGIPVVVGFNNDMVSRRQFSYGTANEPATIGRYIQAHVSALVHSQNFMFAYNPLGASAGFSSTRAIYVGLPVNALIGLSLASMEYILKVDTPTESVPAAVAFSSKTWASTIDRQIFELVSKVEDQELRSLVIGGKDNVHFGLQSSINIRKCESQNPGRLLLDFFKPSEINSDGSGAGWLLMSLAQLRNYFFNFPPKASCSAIATFHRASKNPSTAVEIRLTSDNNIPAGKKHFPGKTYKNIKCTVTMLGEIERKWKIEASSDKEVMNVKSAVNVKVIRQPVPILEIPGRAVCLSVKTAWTPLPEIDFMETPTPLRPPFVKQDWSLIWGEIDTDQCPKPKTKGISSIKIKVAGNITQEQRDVANSRNSYPYDECDVDYHSRRPIIDVRSPLTKVSFQH